MATIIVTNNADSGAGSLREALAIAAAGDTIQFGPGLAGSTIALQSTLTISQDVLIDGQSNNITISGQGAVTDFAVTAGNVEIDNLTIADGHGAGADGAGGSTAGSGGSAAGGLLVQGGSVTLNGDTFANDTARGGNGGFSYSSLNGGAGGDAAGAILVQSGSVALNGDSFSADTASGGDGGESFISVAGTGGNAAGAVLVETGGTVSATSNLHSSIVSSAAGAGGGAVTSQGTPGAPGTAYPVSNISAVTSADTSSNTVTVTTFNGLVAAIMAADRLAANTGAIEIDVSGTIAETGDPTAVNFASGNTLVIKGVNGGTLDGQDPTDTTTHHRGLFVYSGTVTIQDLTIENARAIGGSGGPGAGGGAGLGGGLFVAGPNPVSVGSATSSAGGNVTLSGVTFLDDGATGGAGGSAGGYGGGGGLGGDGNTGAGGVGASAQGGSNSPGGPGIVPGAAPGGSRLFAYPGSASGGGGGGSNGDGGGGGIGGVSNGSGGFGGGGGTNSAHGDGGGFGGGGGGGADTAGAGGFGGGGGGGGAFSNSSAGGGFGGGAGGPGGGNTHKQGGGGGGLGAGGDIFVQEGGVLTIEGGSLSGGTVTAGLGANGGSDGKNYGAGIFLQGTGNSLTLTRNADGSGFIVSEVITDQDGSAGPGGGGAVGVTIGTLALSGTVTLTAADTYSGATTITAGSTLQLGDGTPAGLGSIDDTSGIADGGALIVDDSSNVTIAAPITGAGTLLQEGVGTTVLTGVSSYTGATTVAAGALLVDGSTADSATEAQTGTTLGGDGTLGGVTVDSGGTLAPGDSSLATPGILTAASLSMASGATYAVQLGDATAGTGYAETTVNGVLNLDSDNGAGATLKLQLASGYMPLGQSFTLISNAGGAAVQGTFAGLAEGASVTAGNATFKISYAGGSGQDVTLTDESVAVSSFDQLNAEIQAADALAANTGALEIDVSGTITETGNLTAINLNSGNTLTIKGVNGGTLDGGGQYRGFFAYSGTVAILDLTIQNAHAIGGAGGPGGGGGAGLGGGLFVAGTDNSSPDGPAAVTLSDVVFKNDHATGGSGGSGYNGGGGGLGGNGSGNNLNPGSGGSGYPGANGFGGGGGGGGGNGGFGGGGGGGLYQGGRGGFGGGGGSEQQQASGGGAGGFGAGGGAYPNGGGGLGAGGDVFVQEGGSLTVLGGSLGTVQSPGGVAGGAALGTGLFLQGNQGATLAAAAGATNNVVDTIADQGGAGGAGSLTIGIAPSGNDPGQTGTVVLDPLDANGQPTSNSYTGGTTIAAGTLELDTAYAAGMPDAGHPLAGTIAFAPNANATLALGAGVLAPTGGTFTDPISGFRYGDSIDLLALSYQAGATYSYSGSLLRVTSGGVTDNLEVTNPGSAQFIVGQDSSNHVQVTEAPAPYIDGATNTSVTGAVSTTPFSGVTLYDPLNGNNTLTITPTSGVTLTGAGTPAAGVYTLTGTASAVTSQLRAITFTPAAAGHPNGSVTTDFALSDTSDAMALTSNAPTVVVTETDPSDAPTITNNSTPQTSTNESATTPFMGATLTDDNAASGTNNPSTATDTLTITLQGGTGTLSEGASYTGLQTLTPTGAPGTYTLTGTGAAITAELDKLVFTPAAGAPNSTTTTTFVLSDASSAQPSGTPATNGASQVTDTDSAVAPTIANTSAAQSSTDESTATPFTGATVSDPNAAGSGNNTGGSATDTLTITLQGGTGTLSDAQGFTGGTLAPGGTAQSYTLTGTGQAITTELEQLVFTPGPAGNPNGSVTTTFELSDQSGVGGFSNTNSASQVTETDSPVAPTISNASLPQTSTNESRVSPFTAAVVTDGNSASGFDTPSTATDTLTITLQGGTGTLHEGTGFAGTKTLSGSGSTYTLAGTGAAITAELQQLTFTPDAGTPNTSTTTTFELSDLSSAEPNGTPATNSTSQVTDNDPAVAPTITGTHSTPTTSEAAVQPFSGVTISDRNANATDRLTVQLSGQGAGGQLSGSGLSGGQNGTYTIAAASASAVTAILDGLVFTPGPGAPNSSTPTTFALTDQVTLINGGNPLAGPSTNDSNSVVTDTDLPVRPTIAGTHSSTTNNEQPVTPFSGVTISDPNAASGSRTGGTATDTLTIQLSNNGAGGTLAGSGLSGGQNGTYVLAPGRAATVQAELRALVFTPKAGQANSSTATSFGLTDASSAGTTSTVDRASTVTDVDAAVAASFSGEHSTITVSETPVMPFAGVTISDPNANSTDTLTIQLSGAGGTLAGAGLSGGQNGAYTLGTSTAANVENALQGLVFTPVAGAPDTQSVTQFTLTDTNPHGSVSSSGTSVVDVDPAVVPTIAGTHPTTTTSEQPVTPFSGVTIGDTNAGATETLSIVVSGPGGTLSGAGLNLVGADIYSLSGTAAQVMAALQGLAFTPAAGAAPNTRSTSFLTLIDQSSAGSSIGDGATSVTDIDPAVVPTIAGTHAISTVSEAAVTPFSGVTLADPNAGATDTLTIQLSGGGSGGTLIGSGLSGGQNGVYILGAGTASDIQNQLQALVFTPVPGAPGTQSSTGFTLIDQSSAGTSASDGGTSVTDIDPSTPVDTTPPTVVFDASVTLANANTAIFTGTVSDNVGVAAVTLFEGDTALGNATVNPDGTWSFTADFAPGFHSGISAVATDTSGNTSSAPSDFDLTTGTRSGIPGQPYRTIQDRYDADGNFLGQTFFKADGSVLFSSDYAVLPNGNSSYTYSGGSFFKGKDYSSFTNIYDPNGTLIEDIENKRDGSHLINSHYIETDPNGQTVHSIHNDTFANNGANERFVFSKGFGHDTIAGFIVGGPGHDTIVLPSFDAAHLAQIIAHAQTVNGDTTFQVDKQDSITLTGVTKKQLEAHLEDFKFHA